VVAWFAGITLMPAYLFFSKERNGVFSNQRVVVFPGIFLWEAKRSELAPKETIASGLL
jgi:hypothetical protein